MFAVLLSIAKGKAICSSIRTSPQCRTLLNNVYKLYCTKKRVNESYQKLKNAFKKLHDDYLHINGQNIFSKYFQMKQMIYEVIILDEKYWELIDVPEPEPSEAAKDYVIRVMELVNVTQLRQTQRLDIATLLGIETILECTAKRAIFESKKNMSASDLQIECDRMYATLYRLLRKYLKLRAILRRLNSNFRSSRFLPVIPRYNLLKSMIKNVIREPTFAEIYHEPDI